VRLYPEFIWLEKWTDTLYFMYLGSRDHGGMIWKIQSDTVCCSDVPNLKRTSISVISQDFELMPRETRIQGPTRYSRVFHGTFPQTAPDGCRSPSVLPARDRRMVPHLRMLCASNSHIVQLTNETVSTFGLDVGRMSCFRALFGFSGRTSRDNTSINNDGRNFNNQRATTYYQTTCAN